MGNDGPMSAHDTTGLIPGLTMQAERVLRLVVSSEINKALDERLKDLACPDPCPSVAELKASVYGNGTTGLKSRVVVLETQTADLIWYKRATIVAALGLMANVAVTIAVTVIKG